MNGGHVTLDQLAAQWLLRSAKIFKSPFSSESYVAALKEAEQLLWAGSEMDLVSLEPPSFSIHVLPLKLDFVTVLYEAKNFTLDTGARHSKEFD